MNEMTRDDVDVVKHAILNTESGYDYDYQQELKQKITNVQPIENRIPINFASKFMLEPHWFIGYECVRPGKNLELHTDIGGRTFNILINCGKHVATIQHSNNGETESVDIQPGEVFYLDTSKPHGCDNTGSDWICEFVTVNPRMKMQEYVDHIDV
jgi:hypothetical protein